jgi:hypothetical protein
MSARDLARISHLVVGSVSTQRRCGYPWPVGDFRSAPAAAGAW